ncbi:MAG: hypothetical protein KKB20_11475 [Proteobacteria bacterium]|nr:hypothetical protein [Pseudomonadota bacterium]
MADLTSADVVVVVQPPDRDVGHGALMKNLTLARITFGDGALTYPAGGIPLPGIGSFGFLRQLQFVAIQGAADGFVYKYDPDNHKLKIFTQGLVTGSTPAAVNENGALVENSAGAEGAVRLPNTVADTTYDLGGLIELPATIAPAATTLTLLMFGE